MFRVQCTPTYSSLLFFYYIACDTWECSMLLYWEITSFYIYVFYVDFPAVDCNQGFLGGGGGGGGAMFGNIRLDSNSRTKSYSEPCFCGA